MGILKLCIALFCLLFIQIEATETGANRTCPNDSLPCNDGECVSREKWCDGERNCQDESDEAYCKKKSWINNNPNNCGTSHFKCEMIGYCIPLVGRCDGFQDCKDKSDEWDCEPETFDDYDDYLLSYITTVVPTKTTTIESSSESNELENDDIATTAQSSHPVLTQGGPLPSSTGSLYTKRIEQESIRTDMPHSTKPSRTTPNALPVTEQDTSQVTIKNTISSKSLPVPSSTSFPHPTRPYQAGFHNGHNYFTSRYHPTSFYFSGHHPTVQQPYVYRQQTYDSRQQPYDSSQQSYDTRQQLYDNRQPIYNSRQSYDSRQKPYDSRQQFYDSRQQPYDSRQQLYNSRQQSYDTRQQLYDNRQPIYNSRQPYDSRQQPYDTRQQPYDYRQQSYGSRQQSNEPRRNPDQYPYHRPRMYSFRGQPTVQTREVIGHENLTANEASPSGSVTPTETTVCSDQDSSQVQHGGQLGSKKRKTKISEAEKRIETALKFFQIFAEKPEKDESSVFCELLCIQLKEMDANIRQIAMHDINSLIFHLKRAHQNAVDGYDTKHFPTATRYFEDQQEASPSY